MAFLLFFWGWGTDTVYQSEYFSDADFRSTWFYILPRKEKACSFACESPRWERSGVGGGPKLEPAYAQFYSPVPKPILCAGHHDADQQNVTTG